MTLENGEPKNAKGNIDEENSSGGAGGDGLTEGGSDDDENDSDDSEEDDNVKMTPSQLNARLKRAEEAGAKRAAKQFEDEQNEAKRLSKLTEKERQKEIEQNLHAEIAALKAEKVKFEMQSTARQSLAEQGVVADDDILNMIVTTEAETTMSNVTAFIKAVQKASDAKYEEARRGKTPRNGGDAGKEEAQTVGARLGKASSETQKIASKAKDPFAR